MRFKLSQCTPTNKVDEAAVLRKQLLMARTAALTFHLHQEYSQTLSENTHTLGIFFFLRFRISSAQRLLLVALNSTHNTGRDTCVLRPVSL